MSATFHAFILIVLFSAVLSQVTSEVEDLSKILQDQNNRDERICNTTKEFKVLYMECLYELSSFWIRERDEQVFKCAQLSPVEVLEIYCGDMTDEEKIDVFQLCDAAVPQVEDAYPPLWIEVYSCVAEKFRKGGKKSS